MNRRRKNYIRFYICSDATEQHNVVFKKRDPEQLPPENIVDPTPQDTTSDSPAQQASLI
ncbi:hypothetical protein [Corynebacterium rouxii]|uniref:hypothetical protein n=1 Tax=Corynebacterium rouxii TaxID=2719119 RepID=UPI0012DC3C8B|nr:hypothetical protein [Corynebacterium rouxii]